MPVMPLERVRHFVVTSDWTVGFTDGDPHGHMATARYLSLTIDHRVESFASQLGVDWYKIARELGVTYITTELRMRYLRPAFPGERLQFASWTETIGQRTVLIRVVVLGAVDRAVRAIARLDMIAVDTKTGRPVDNPENLPTDRDDAGADRPPVADFLAQLKGLPSDWASL